MIHSTRSSEEPRQASDHLYNEKSMFQILVQGMISRIAGQSAINNALLEFLFPFGEIAAHLTNASTDIRCIANFVHQFGG